VHRRNAVLPGRPPPGSQEAMRPWRGGTAPARCTRRNTDTLSTVKRFWLVPVGDRQMLPAIECLRVWLSSGQWGLSPRYERQDRPTHGDSVAFYVAKMGIAAMAIVREGESLATIPLAWPEPSAPREVLLLTLSSVRWLSAPRQVDLDLRRRLDAFQGWAPRHVEYSWGGFVRSVREISEGDFHLLAGQYQPTQSE